MFDIPAARRHSLIPADRAADHPPECRCKFHYLVDDTAGRGRNDAARDKRMKGGNNPRWYDPLEFLEIAVNGLSKLPY